MCVLIGLSVALRVGLRVVAGVCRPVVVLLAGIGFSGNRAVISGGSIRLAVVLRVTSLIPRVVRASAIIVMAAVVLCTGGVSGSWDSRTAICALAVAIGGIAALGRSSRTITTCTCSAMGSILVHAGWRVTMIRITSMPSH